MLRLWNETIATHRHAVREAILDTTWALVAEGGLRAVTMSQVAVRAGIGRATLYKYFPKEALFAAVARWGTPVDGLLGATRTELPQAALDHLLDAFDDPERRAAAEALLRSFLTHPAAGAAVREQVMGPTQERVAATIGGPDAALRAAVLNACMLGLTISRYLLSVPAAADATAADLDRVLRPALQRLVEPS